MSYDVSLYDEANELTSRNMTSNVACMWRHAGADLAEFHGKKAGPLIPVLEKVIESMTRYPNTYRKMNPPNGWGDSESCLEFLKALVQDFEQFPHAIIHVSY